jgi:hypothetical protein
MIAFIIVIGIEQISLSFSKKEPKEQPVAQQQNTVTPQEIKTPLEPTIERKIDTEEDVMELIKDYAEKQEQQKEDELKV